MTIQTEIAYLKTGFVRVMETDDGRFEVQSLRIRGRAKLGASPTAWGKLYGVYDRDKAIRLLESYAR